MERKIFWITFTILCLVADFVLPVWWALAVLSQIGMARRNRIDIVTMMIPADAARLQTRISVRETGPNQGRGHLPTRWGPSKRAKPQARECASDRRKPLPC